MNKLIFIYILFYSTITYSESCPHTNTKTIEQTKKEAQAIYKHTEAMYIRLSNEEKYNVEKKLHKDNSLRIWLK